MGRGTHRGFITYEELNKSLGKRNLSDENLSQAFIHILDENVTLVEKKSQYQSNKKKDNTKDNVLSAIEFIENPIIKNLLMQQINVSDKKKKKLELTMKNLTDVIELNENMESNLEELFSEIDKIGISEFLSKWKKNN